MPNPVYEPAHCVVCAHAESRVIAEHEDVQAEVEWLWEYQQRRLRSNTPARSLFDRVAFSQHAPFRLVQCVECGTIYRNPTERERELTATYAGDTAAPGVLRSLHANQLPTARAQARRLRAILGRGGSVLEVGSYAGSFLAAGSDEGFSIEGLDINENANAFVRSMGFAVHSGTLPDFATDRLFDAVAIWNTFDQLADPRGAIYEARARLRPGGILALRVPNGAVYAAMRARLSNGNGAVRAAARSVLAQNNLLAFPYRWGFTARALSRVLIEGGFSICRFRGDVLVLTADQWTRGWARVEERLVKAVLSGVARRSPVRAPWLEVYARRE